jgi:hypothetical protein
VKIVLGNLNIPQSLRINVANKQILPSSVFLLRTAIHVECIGRG